MIPIDEVRIEELARLDTNVDFVGSIFDCPRCNAKFRCKILQSDLTSESGMINSVINLPCGHTFSVFMDVNGKIRSFSPLKKVDIRIEQIDVEFLKRSLVLLQKIHDNTDVTGQWKVFEQIKEVRNEILKVEKRMLAEKEPEESKYIFI